MLVGSGLSGTNYTAGSLLNATMYTVNASDTSASPTDAIAQFRINISDDLMAYKEGSGAWTSLGTWNDDGVTDTLFDVRWSPTGDTGNLTAGSDSLATWLNLSGTRLWGIEVTGPTGAVSMTGTVEIRDAATLDVLSSATATLTAEEAI
jgi:choline dehydrogenase-like flavoprotein